MNSPSFQPKLSGEFIYPSFYHQTSRFHLSLGQRNSSKSFTPTPLNIPPSTYTKPPNTQAVAERFFAWLVAIFAPTGEPIHSRQAPVAFNLRHTHSFSGALLMPDSDHAKVSWGIWYQTFSITDFYWNLVQMCKIKEKQHKNVQYLNLFA